MSHNADIVICYKESQLPSFCRFVDVTISIDEIWQKSCLLHYVRFKALVHDKEWHLVQKRSSDKYNKMVKDTHTIRRQFLDELFECVWPFCGIGT